MGIKWERAPKPEGAQQECTAGGGVGSLAGTVGGAGCVGDRVGDIGMGHERIHMTLTLES